MLRIYISPVRIINKRMNTKNISILRKISTNELQELLNVSTSLTDTISKLGLPRTKSHYIDILRLRILNEKLDTTIMSNNFNNNKKNKSSVNVDLVFTANSRYARGVARNKVLKLNLIEYRCAECPVVDTYNGKPVSLQLDHINGCRNDHRLENLRWLCPTCHSQQETSFGRGKGNNKLINLCECGTIIKGIGTKCRSCANKANSESRILKFEVSKDKLEALVKAKPMSEIGKMFGVSDNAVKKRCKKLGIELKPMRGHWTKVKAGIV